MTLHPKPKASTPESNRNSTRKPTRREPRPLTLGDLLGAQVRGVQAQRARRAELDDMGFKPLGAA